MWSQTGTGVHFSREVTANNTNKKLPGRDNNQPHYVHVVWQTLQLRFLNGFHIYLGIYDFKENIQAKYTCIYIYIHVCIIITVYFRIPYNRNRIHCFLFKSDIAFAMSAILLKCFTCNEKETTQGQSIQIGGISLSRGKLEGE